MAPPTAATDAFALPLQQTVEVVGIPVAKNLLALLGSAAIVVLLGLSAFFRRRRSRCFRCPPTVWRRSSTRGAAGPRRCGT